jgi:hypothetical protein
MQPEYHLFVSAGLASVFYLLTGSVTGSVAVFFGGFFIDFDHFIDFWMYKRKVTYTNEFFSKYHMRFGKVLIPLHSVELLWVMYMVQMLTGSVLLLGLCAGMAVHLVMDMFGNGLNPFSYFLFYRLINRFDKDRLLPKRN